MRRRKGAFGAAIGATARCTSADLGWRTLHTQGGPAPIIPPLSRHDARIMCVECRHRFLWCVCCRCFSRLLNLHTASFAKSQCQCTPQVTLVSAWGRRRSPLSGSRTSHLHAPGRALGRPCAMVMKAAYSGLRVLQVQRAEFRVLPRPRCTLAELHLRGCGEGCGRAAFKDLYNVLASSSIGQNH